MNKLATIGLVILLAVFGIVYAKDLHDKERYLYTEYSLSPDRQIKDEYLENQIIKEGSEVEPYWLCGNRLTIYKYQDHYYGLWYDHSGMMVPEN